MLSLNIGENDPVGNLLVSIEMNKVSETQFNNKSLTPSRKRSIDKIFGKMVKVDTDNAKNEEAFKKLFTPKPIRKTLYIPKNEIDIYDPDTLTEIPTYRVQKNKSPLMVNSRKKSLQPLPPKILKFENSGFYMDD